MRPETSEQKQRIGVIFYILTVQADPITVTIPMIKIGLPTNSLKYLRQPCNINYQTLTVFTSFTNKLQTTVS